MSYLEEYPIEDVFYEVDCWDDFYDFDYDDFIERRENQYLNTNRLFEITEGYQCVMQLERVQVTDISILMRDAVPISYSLWNEYQRRLKIYVSITGSDDIQHFDDWLFGWTPRGTTDKDIDADTELFETAFKNAFNESNCIFKNEVEAACYWQAKQDCDKFLEERFE